MVKEEQCYRYRDWLDKLKMEFQSESEERLFMTWHELQKLAESKLVTIGAHTLSHPVLANLRDEAAYTEIEQSKRILSKRLKREISHLAFPFGGTEEISARDIQYAREIGFTSAVTTRYGAVRAGGNVDLFALPRVFFGPDFHLHSIWLRILKTKIKIIAERLVGTAR